MKYREAAKKLQRLHCQELPRRKGGSHRKWFNPATGRAAVLPGNPIQVPIVPPLPVSPIPRFPGSPTPLCSSTPCPHFSLSPPAATCPLPAALVYRVSGVIESLESLTPRDPPQPFGSRRRPMIGERRPLLLAACWFLPPAFAFALRSRRPLVSWSPIHRFSGSPFLRCPPSIRTLVPSYAPIRLASCASARHLI